MTLSTMSGKTIKTTTKRLLCPHRHRCINSPDEPFLSCEILGSVICPIRLMPKLNKRVKSLNKLSNELSSVPLSEFDKKTLRLLQLGIEVILDRLMSVYNDTSDKLKIKIHYKKEGLKYGKN